MTREVMLIDCEKPALTVLELQAAAFRRLARMCKAHPTKWVKLMYLDDLTAACNCDGRERFDVDVAGAIEQVANDENARSLHPAMRLDRDTEPSAPPWNNR